MQAGVMQEPGKPQGDDSMEEQKVFGMPCHRASWVAAAAFGIVVLWLLAGRFGAGIVPGLIAGVVVAAGAGILLTRAFCVDAEELRGAEGSTGATGATGHMPDTRAADPLPTETADVADSHEKAVLETAAAGVPPVTAPPDAGDDRPIEDAVAPEAAPEAPAQATAEAGRKPGALDAPRGGQGDELTRIKGVGPKLAATLNEMGIFHFDQIAAWSQAEVAWMDDNLTGFPGRVSRDDWVGQAQALAAGNDGGGA